MCYDGQRMAKKLTSNLRKQMTAEKLMELGNIAAGALLFGQAFSGFPFNFGLAILGLVVLAWLYTSAWTLMKGGEG
jgi:hypothetical protein